ncbi:MAG: DUF368 domain-containing protein [Candidatus Competibacterales bacterium]
MNALSWLRQGWRQSLALVGKGFCMGAADVVPGVSGGTMAFILGIYAQFLAALRSFDRSWLEALLRLRVRSALTRPHWGFLLPLFAGIVAALLFFTRVVPLPELLKTHPEPVYGLFFGLIVGSILVLLPTVRTWNPRAWACLGLGLGLGLVVVTAVPATTPDAPWFVFLSGALAIAAMMLPGVSGSFVLLLLNKYETVFGAIGRFDFAIIIPFGLGVLVGFVAFSRLLGWLLERYFQAMLLAIIGLLTASLWVIWPFQERQYVLVRGKERPMGSTPLWPEDWNDTVALTVVTTILGLGLVVILHAIAQRRGWTTATAPSNTPS